jgi:hypothetical protein
MVIEPRRGPVTGPFKNEVSDPMSDHENEDNNDFAAQAEGNRTGLAAEFVDFLKENKKWWLAPIIVSILGLGVLVMLGGTAAAPFIYTLF